MKSNRNNQDHDRHPFDQSNYKKYDDFNILEPSPNSYLNFPDDEDDELSDYSLMEIDIDPDFE
jgi:hypothetical protein